MARHVATAQGTLAASLWSGPHRVPSPLLMGLRLAVRFQIPSQRTCPYRFKVLSAFH
jgi:hypothetical protein